MDQETPSTTEYRLRRPTRLVVYGGVVLIGMVSVAWALSMTRPAAGPHAWAASALIAVLLAFAVITRVSRRSSESIIVDDAGITSVGRAGYRTLPWDAVARLHVSRLGGLELSDANRLARIALPRALEHFPELAREVLTHLAAAYARRPAGAWSRSSDVPATFSSSVVPEALQALGVWAFSLGSAWWSVPSFVLGLVTMPVTFWRLSHVPYAISVGPVVGLRTLAWTREIPAACLTSITLDADDSGRPLVIADDVAGTRTVIVVSRLSDQALELYDRLRRLCDANGSEPAAGAWTKRVAPRRAGLFLAGALAIATLTASIPVFNGGLLRFAAERGSLPLARAALALGSPIDSSGLARGTPLYQAAKAGRLAVVQLLLDHGADPAARERDRGFTPLHVAGEYGHVEIVRLLLAAGAKPDVRNDWEQTPLWQVSWQKRPTDVAVARLLIDAGATVDAADKDGFTPLLVTARHCNLPLLTYLASRGASLVAVTRRGNTPLSIAITNGSADCVRALARAGADLNASDAEGRIPLLEAVARGDRLAVDLLLSAGARVDVYGRDGYAALQNAAWHGNRDLVTLLLQHHADPNQAPGGSAPPLNLAVQRGHRETVRALVDGGARSDIPFGGYTALQRAAWQGETDMVSAMLDRGANPDPPSPTHPPPIVLAAERGHLAVVSLLVDRGADVNARYEGWTALRAAELRGHAAVVQYVRARGGTR